MKNRKKLNFRWFMGLIVAGLAVLWIIAIVLPIVSVVQYDLVFRDIFGEAATNAPSGDTDGVDATYYKKDYESSAKLHEDEQAYTRKAGAEGFVLLYNKEDNGKGLPLAKDSKLSLFSASSVDLLAGGTGSGVSTISSDMKTALTEQGFSINEKLWKFYSDNHNTYKRGGGAISYGGAEDWSINEAPLDKIPADAKTEAAGTTPVFFIARTGGEGRDLGRYMGDWTKSKNDKSKHYLEPDSVELGVINYLNENFDNVIIVVNTNNAFELGWVKDYKNISTVLWAPGAGGDTCRSIADVFSGKINPSGHLVDTFAYDAFSSPAMQNMGDIVLTNGGQNVGEGLFYDEGIYVGYKYYETRYFDKVLGQGKAGEYDYDTVVQYPFGYGKTYTTFAWSDFKMTQPDENGDINVSVKVKNTGTVAGREVVQVYVNVPYTEYDKTNHIEKSAVSLVGFGKTAELAANAEETVTVTLNIKDFISYDDVVSKTYILEAGKYYVTAATDAHEATKNVLTKYGATCEAEGGNGALVGEWEYNYTENNGVDKTTYAKSANGTQVTNQFDHAVNDEFTKREEYLTRNDWKGTFPKTHGNQDNEVKSSFSEKNGYTWQLSVSDSVKNAIKAKDSMNPMTDEEAAEKAGQYKQAGELELIDYRGKDYDELEKSGAWDKLIDQMDTAEMKSIIEKGGYQTLNAKSIGKPRAIDFDGPSGLNEGGVTHEPYSITYPCAANLAASWDRENSRLHGYYVGEDGLAADGSWGKHNYKGIISGWYAPAMNIHRTPFAGRNFEYYSEDGFMSGELALEAAVACAEKGVYAYIKHFALNDQEDHRSHVATFSNEQAIREIYLKPFQTCIEERGNTKIMVQEYNEETGEFTKKEVEIPAVMGVMTAFNRIGCVWAGGNYNLITGVLRNEWGFNGTVITDYDQGGVMDTEQCIRAGGDIKLTAYGSGVFVNMNNKASQYFARQSMKHVLYTTVNSNAMNGIIHGVEVADLPFAYYNLIIIAVEVITVGLTTWGVLAILQRYKKEKQLANAPETASGEPEGPVVDEENKTE